MVLRYADRVRHATLSVGTGQLVLGQSPAGYQTLDDAGIAIGDTTDISIEDPLTGAWEVTRATRVGVDQVARGDLQDSSTGGRISFGAGVKWVTIVLPAAKITEGKDAAEAAASAAQASEVAAAAAEAAAVPAASTALTAAQDANAAADRAIATADSIRGDPTEQTIALAVVDDTGNTALELTGDAKEFRVAGAALRRNDDASVELLRHDGVGFSVKLTGDGVQVADQEHVAAPPGIQWAVADGDGFAGMALLTDGTAQIAGLRIGPTDAGGVELRTPAGDLFYNAGDGIGGLTFSTMARDDVAVAWVDAEGFIGFALRPDGTAIGTGLGGGSTDPGAGGAYSDTEIQARNAANLARAAQVARNTNFTGQRPTATYNHFISYGQSLSIGQEGWPALTVTAPFAGVLSHGLSIRSNGSAGTSVWTPYGSDAFSPLVATVTNLLNSAILTPVEQAALTPGSGEAGETPLEAALISLRRAWNNARAVEDDPDRLFVASATGSGGKSLAELSKPSAWHSRIVDCAAKVRAKALALGGTYCIPAVIWLQGEQDYADGTTKEGYKAGLKQIIADLRADMQVGVAGQDKPFIFMTYQTGGSYSNDALNLAVGMAQFELMLEEPDFFLAAPVYAVTDKGGHLDPNGYRWDGEYFGQALGKILVQGQGWRPLHPTSLTKRGREVLIDFHVPEPPLVWGMPFVTTTATDYPTKGFVVRDNSGDNAITAVEIVADTMVRITLARDPVGTAHLRYAGKATFNGNGCLRDSNPARSFFTYEYSAGTGQYAAADIPALVGQPYPLANWCLAFDLPVIDS
ncbi:hypothetical protein GCM10011320_21950 [Neoroseomonas lacus]|uniref:Sialate O-acetylesterase domain-containing protein n=2 Tax=Neoroseomonas lacus TaxID=287609 RepID=A0A917KK08_9PROT|nr:hypothetical protein GCM10011320_21950 [Neoroseomonas lacus]